MPLLVSDDLWDFQQDINEHILLEELADTMSQTEAFSPQRVGGDKWRLVSNLHKAIRRGNASLAIASALSLLEIDPGYLLRRLPVIALEDVSFGNLHLCALILASAGRRRFLERLGIECVIAKLVGDLAASPKSRTGCDLISLSESHREAESASPTFSTGG